MNTLRLRWLFFDLGDTLWRSSTAESRRAAGLYVKAGQRMSDWLRKRGHRPPPDGAALLERIWNEVDAASKLAERTSAIAEGPGAAIKRILASSGISVSLEDGEEVWRLTAQAPAPERGITLIRDAAITLEALACRGLRLGVITNRTLDTAATRRDLESLGLGGCFEHVIVSADVGYAKPHPRIFQAALGAAGARPQECALVGDNLRTDVQGAQDAGLFAIWKRSALTATDHPVTPDATIERLAELLDLVEPLRS